MNFSKAGLILLLLTPSAETAAIDKHIPNTASLEKYSRPVPSTPLQALQQRAANGDALALYELGTKYFKGTGVKQDYAAAFAWYRQAAEKDHAEAQFMLGGMYDEGLAVPQDYETAAKWNLKAAEQGHAGALYNLGMLYSVGDGVQRDLVQAHMWFNLAAAKGNSAGVEGRKRCEAKMSQWQLGEAQAMARQWQAKYR